MEKNLVKRNILITVLLQVISIISGFIVPKIILNQFGSAVNGLVSSINQFLSYVVLLEGGLGGVVRAALYKPLKENNKEEIYRIFKIADGFFKKIAVVYLFYVAVLILFYPRLVQTEYSILYCALLILVLAINLFVQYYFSITYKILLISDRKVYIVSLTQLIIILLNMVAVVFTTSLFKDIVIVKFLSALVFLIQPLVFIRYVKKYYEYINSDHICLRYNENGENDIIKQRWNGLAVSVAAFVHSNTGIVILTVFSTLTNVSVYAIYAMILGAVKSLAVSVSKALEPSFGHVLAANDLKNSNVFFDKYTLIVSVVVTFLFTCTMLLITPFIDVYTSGITDANYHQVSFGIILTIAEMIYCFREPYIMVAYSSGLYKEVSKQAMFEAIINVLISIILVQKVGLIGVAIGSCCAMFYRMADQILFVKRNVLFRPINYFLKSIMVSGTVIIITSFLSAKFVNLVCNTYVEWLICSVKIALICLSVLGVFCYLFYKKQLNNILRNGLS